MILENLTHVHGECAFSWEKPEYQFWNAHACQFERKIALFQRVTLNFTELAYLIMATHRNQFVTQLKSSVWNIIISYQNFESQKIIDFLQFQNINRHLLCILLYLLPLILWSSCLRKQINNEQFHRNKFWIWNQLQRSQWSSVRVVPSHTSPKRLAKLWNDRVLIHALDISLYT